MIGTSVVLWGTSSMYRLFLGLDTHTDIDGGIESENDMMAAAILVVSMLTLLMFLVTYCRSLMASSARCPLSKEVRDVAGIASVAAPQDFERVMRLLRLSGNRAETHASVRTIALYHRILTVFERAAAHIAPSVGSWAEQERARCAHFAALILDRQIGLVLHAPE